MTDEDVRQDYQSVPGPVAIIAGPSAQRVRSGEFAEAEISWLKSSFFKIEQLLADLGELLDGPESID